MLSADLWSGSSGLPFCRRGRVGCGRPIYLSIFLYIYLSITMTHRFQLTHHDPSLDCRAVRLRTDSYHPRPPISRSADQDMVYREILSLSHWRRDYWHACELSHRQPSNVSGCRLSVRWVSTGSARFYNYDIPNLETISSGVLVGSWGTMERTGDYCTSFD